jgi:hypothetical protein
MREELLEMNAAIVKQKELILELGLVPLVILSDIIRIQEMIETDSVLDIEGEEWFLYDDTEHNVNNYLLAVRNDLGLSSIEVENAFRLFEYMGILSFRQVEDKCYFKVKL